MAEPLSIAKLVFGGLQSIYSYFSKKNAQPKLEISVQRSNRSSRDLIREGDALYMHDVFKHEVRVTNCAEPTAYHVKAVSADFPIVYHNVDYHLPIPANESKTYYVDILHKYEVKEGDKIVDRPSPMSELRLEYDNGKGKRFFTVLSPKLPQEARHKFGKM